MSEGGYIQGAGDDSEGWSHGLTPPVFWANKSTLFATEESDLPELIEQLVEEHRKHGAGPQATPIQPTRNLYIGQAGDASSKGEAYDLVIACHDKPVESEGDAKKLNLGCSASKLGSRDLRKALDKVTAFVETHLSADPSRTLLVTCETGKDLSVGTLLAIICLFYDDNGKTTVCIKHRMFLVQLTVLRRPLRRTTNRNFNGQAVYSAATGMDCHVQA